MSAASRRSPSAKASRRRTRLPWWAPALPVISFTVLLVLAASPTAARAASAPQGLPPLLELLAGILRAGAW
ncbi:MULTISPECIES: hypothetical protein [Streptomyces]|uniref:hypothetical protein n=1 Tax=Streptomyces TaxID=1883 RepID=UPI001FCB72B9|nr:MULTISPECIES: hypothetical protein [Streptomyces]MCL7497297.1 hypothetical protein [Streptomyces sp. MCA2]BDH11023.1 hypothetical protein HOK021_22020 [Streptomyces hygroscopicus]